MRHRAMARRGYDAQNRTGNAALRNRLLDWRERAGEGGLHHYCAIAATESTCLRSSNFWIFPVDVFGRGPNTTAFGDLKPGSCLRQNARISASSALAPSFSSTKAQGTSPHFLSGLATTAANSTAGCLYSTSSTSTDEMFSPPEMMMSFERSLIMM